MSELSDDLKYMIYGTPIRITDCITKKVRVRRNRKKRIDKKWRKRYGFKEVPDNEKIIYAKFPFPMLFMTQKCYEKIKRSM